MVTIAPLELIICFDSTSEYMLLSKIIYLKIKNLNKNPLIFCVPGKQDIFVEIFYRDK